MDRERDYLTVEQARRAIYFDFEGFEERSPSLLGVLDESGLVQISLDDRIAEAATATGLRLSELNREVRSLVSRCEDELRLLVGFSSYEKTVCSRFAGLDISPHYRDGRKIAKRWINSSRPRASHSEHTLRHFLLIIGEGKPSYLGVRQSTRRLRCVIEMLALRGAYSDLTPVAKGKWTKFLQNNAADCQGLKRLIEYIAEDRA
jgi:hypothetical protein